MKIKDIRVQLKNDVSSFTSYLSSFDPNYNVVPKLKGSYSVVLGYVVSSIFGTPTTSVETELMHTLPEEGFTSALVSLTFHQFDWGMMPNSLNHLKDLPEVLIAIKIQVGESDVYYVEKEQVEQKVVNDFCRSFYLTSLKFVDLGRMIEIMRMSSLRRLSLVQARMRSTREDLISDVSDLKDKLSKIESSIENKEKIIEDLVPKRDASKKALADRYCKLDKEERRLFNALFNIRAELDTRLEQIFEKLESMKQYDELSNDEENLIEGNDKRTTYFKGYCDLLKAEYVIELLSPFLVKAKQEEEKLKKKTEELASARERAMKDADAEKTRVVSLKEEITALRAVVHDFSGAFVAVKRQKGDDEARFATRAILDGTSDGFVDGLVLYKEKQKDLLKAEDSLEKLKGDIGNFELVSRGLEGDQNDTTACVADLEKSIKKATDGAAEVKATYPELDSNLDITLKGVDITGELKCYIKKRSERGKSVNRTRNEVSKWLKTQSTKTSTQTSNALNSRDLQLEMKNIVKLHPWIVEEARSTDPWIIEEASSTSRKPDSLYSSANEGVEVLSGDVADVAERIKIAENDLQQLKGDKEKIEGEISAWSTRWDDVFRVLEKDFVETSKGLLPDFKSIELVATEKGLDVTCDENVVNMACLDNRAHKLSLSLLLGMCNPTQSSIIFLDRIDAYFNADDILLIKDTLTHLFPNQQFILMAKNMGRHQSLVSLSVEPSEPSH